MAKRNPKSERFNDEDREARYQNKGTGNKKRRHRGKGKGSKGKGYQYGKDKLDPKNLDRGYSNAVEWWMKAGQLSLDTSSISTLEPIGMPGPAIMRGSNPDNEHEYDNYTPSGVARFDYIPFFGKIDSPIHPVNSAAKLMYDFINSKNSRNTNYDPSDLMIYCIAVANAWTVYTWVCRVAGMFNSFSTLNRYWYAPILTSMGVQANSVAHDVTKWRNLANRISLALNVLVVPNVISYFSRACLLPSTIYMDSNSQKSSMWYLSPAYLFKYDYDEQGDTLAGKLTPVTCPWYSGSTVTPESVETYFLNLTENLLNDTDIRLIGSDILKAYGEENLFRLPQITADYTVTPTLDFVMNLQLHNARIYNTGRAYLPGGGAAYELKQDLDFNNIIIADNHIPNEALHSDSYPDAAFMAASGTLEIPFDFPVDQPDNGMVVEASRLTAYNLYGTNRIEACTELLVKDTFFTFHRSADMKWTLTQSSSCVNIGVNNSPSAAQIGLLANRLDMASKLACRPISYLIQRSESNGYLLPTAMAMISDVNNYTTMSTKMLEKMNEACTISIFAPKPLV